MKLSLSLQQDFQAPELVLKPAYIKKVIETALRYIDVNQDCEIGIAFVDNDESHKLNLEYHLGKTTHWLVCLFGDIPNSIYGFRHYQHRQSRFRSLD